MVTEDEDSCQTNKMKEQLHLNAEYKAQARIIHAYRLPATSNFAKSLCGTCDFSRKLDANKSSARSDRAAGCDRDTITHSKVPCVSRGSLLSVLKPRRKKKRYVSASRAIAFKN